MCVCVCVCVCVDALAARQHVLQASAEQEAASSTAAKAKTATNMVTGELAAKLAQMQQAHKVGRTQNPSLSPSVCTRVCALAQARLRPAPDHAMWPCRSRIQKRSVRGVCVCVCVYVCVCVCVCAQQAGADDPPGTSDAATPSTGPRPASSRPPNPLATPLTNELSQVLLRRKANATGAGEGAEGGGSGGGGSAGASSGAGGSAGEDPTTPWQQVRLQVRCAHMMMHCKS